MNGHENVVETLLKLGGDNLDLNLQDKVSECIDGCVCVFSVQ
jgi:hypothetical protein